MNELNNFAIDYIINHTYLNSRALAINYTSTLKNKTPKSLTYKFARVILQLKKNGIIEKYNNSQYKTTSKKELVSFVKKYLKEFSRITPKGLARKYENIYKKTRKQPSSHLVKKFAEIIKDLVDLGILIKFGSYRGNISYIKIINPIGKVFLEKIKLTKSG